MREYQELAAKRLEEIAKYRDAPVEGRNFVHMGRSMDYVTRRLVEMLTLLSAASEHGFYVSYG